MLVKPLIMEKEKEKANYPSIQINRCNESMRLYYLREISIRTKIGEDHANLYICVIFRERTRIVFLPFFRLFRKRV